MKTIKFSLSYFIDMKSNMKQGGVHVATVRDEGFRLMLFIRGNHVEYLILVQDSYVSGKSTFFNFFIISRI